MQQDQINSNRNELGNLSLRDLFYKYIRFLPLFLLSTAVALFIAYAYLRYATPIYSVAGTMYIKTEKSGSRSAKIEDMFVNDKAQNIQSEIEVLKSKPLMSRVVAKLGIQFNYFAKGKIKTPNIYKQSPFVIEGLQLADSGKQFTMKVKFNNENEFTINNEATVFKAGEVFKNGNGVFRMTKVPGVPLGKDYHVTWIPTWAMASSLAASIEVSPKSVGTGILIIGMKTPTSQMGADVINKLMEEYAIYTVEEKNQASDKILLFIGDRLRLLGSELDSLIDARNDYAIKYDLIDIEGQSKAYFDNISEADKLIYEQQLQLNVAEMIGAYLMDKRNEFDKVPSSFNLTDATLNGLIAGYNEVQMERRSLLDANVPVDNPSVKERTQQIEKLRLNILENLKNIKNTINVTVAKLRNQSSLSETQLKKTPVLLKEFNELTRQIETKQGLYKLLQEERERTAISREANIENSKIIDRASPSNSPVKPNRRTIQILAILLGLGLPAMFIFIREVLNDKISTRFDIEKMTSAPILGEVGHSYADKTMIVSRTSRSMVAEQFRIIRSNLQYVIGKIDKSVLLVTSSFSGEGKSFISTNVGAALALAGKRTIILEFDIRKPKILSGLGMDKGPGISNYLVGKASVEEVIRPVPEQENLFVIGCGPIPPNPSELLLGPRVTEMFDWLKQNFDVVIIDTAPVGMVSDAMTLGKFADCTLYLVRQAHTFKKQISLIDELYTDKKLPKVSIIINDVKVKPGYGYYGSGRYGYGYGYGMGGYYEEEHPPKTFLEKLLSLGKSDKKKNK
jgi:tyrosine-protein kinase Etk/Wzc